MDPEKTERFEPIRIRRRTRETKVSLQIAAIVLLILGLIGFMILMATFGR